MIRNADYTLKLLLFFLAFLMYANTIGHDYAWDDSIVITENPRVKNGFSGIPKLFLKYNSDYRSDKYGYRPVVLTSFAIEYGLFRLSPHVGHFMNVIYFSLLCVVLYTVLRKLFFRFSNLVPFLIALLFIVHPIHAEAVANIKSRDEIFALLFSLLSLKQLIQYYQLRKIRSLMFSILLFFAAFLSKESAITFLAIFPLTLLYMNDWKNIKKILLSSSYVALLLIVCLVIVKVYSSSSLGKQASEGAGIFHESGILGNSFFYTSVWSSKLANALTILLLYLKNFFYPVTLLYYYGYNQVPVANWSQPLVLISLLIHIALLIFAIRFIKKQPELSFGIFFYFITISMYTQLLQTLADTMADRFLFTPSLGLCIVTVFVILKILKIDLYAYKAESFLGLEKTSIKKNNLRYTMLIITLLLGIRTYGRNRVWKDNDTLVIHDMPYLYNCSRAHNYYADALKRKLNQAYDAATEEEMISHYRKSYHISGEAYYAYFGLGNYLSYTKRYAEAVGVLDSMLVRYPEQADPNFFLGQVYYEMQQYKKAIPYLEKSLRLAPAVMSTYYVLALTYSKNGDFEKALALTQEAKHRFNESAILYDALGNIYFDKNDLQQSAKNTLEMLRFGENPQNVYGKIIGRFQVKKQDSLAGIYYREAVSKGIFREGSNR